MVNSSTIECGTFGKRICYSWCYCVALLLLPNFCAVYHIVMVLCVCAHDVMWWSWWCHLFRPQNILPSCVFIFHRCDSNILTMRNVVFVLAFVMINIHDAQPLCTSSVLYLANINANLLYTQCSIYKMCQKTNYRDILLLNNCYC